MLFLNFTLITKTWTDTCYKVVGCTNLSICFPSQKAVKINIIWFLSSRNTAPSNLCGKWWMGSWKEIKEIPCQSHLVRQADLIDFTLALKLATSQKAIEVKYRVCVIQQRWQKLKGLQDGPQQALLNIEVWLDVCINRSYCPSVLCIIRMHQSMWHQIGGMGNPDDSDKTIIYP